MFGSDHPAGMGTMEEIVLQVETFGLAEFLDRGGLA